MTSNATIQAGSTVTIRPSAYSRTIRETWAGRAFVGANGKRLDFVAYLVAQPARVKSVSGGRALLTWAGALGGSLWVSLDRLAGA